MIDPSLHPYKKRHLTDLYWLTKPLEPLTHTLDKETKPHRLELELQTRARLPILGLPY